MIFKEHLTSVGRLYLFSETESLVGVSFDPGLKNVLEKRFDTVCTEGVNAVLLEAARQIDEFLAGKRISFDLPVILSGTDFQQKVYAALSEVEYGAVATYKDIADKLQMPNASRAVGGALAANPLLIVVPCHRINARNNMTSGYAGGISVKRKLLQIEADGAILNASEIISENELQNPLLTAYIRKNISVLRFDALLRYANAHNVPISKPETLSFLECLLQMIKPKNVLEIGTAIGYSALFIKSVCPSAHIITIERDADMYFKAKENLNGTGIEIVHGDANEVLKTLNSQFDFVFVDAAKGQYINFYPEVMRLLRQGGAALFDNVLYKGLVSGTRAVAHKHRTIANNLSKFNFAACHDQRATATILPVGDGLLLTIKNDGGNNRA